MEASKRHYTRSKAGRYSEDIINECELFGECVHKKGAIPPLVLNKNIHHEVFGSDDTLSSQKMQFPIYVHGAIIVHFVSNKKYNNNNKKDPIIFAEPLESMIDQSVEKYILQYIHLFCNKCHNQLTNSLQEMKSYSESAFNVGDYCYYKYSILQSKLVQITSINNCKRKMYPSEKADAIVNGITTIDPDPFTSYRERKYKVTEDERKQNLTKIDGFVPNHMLELVLEHSIERQCGASYSIAKSVYWKMSFEALDAKYQNNKILQKKVFMAKIKLFKENMHKLLKQQNVGFKRCIKIEAMNHRIFKSIFKKYLAQALDGVNVWKQNKKSENMSLSHNEMAKLRIPRMVRSENELIGVDGVRFIYKDDTLTLEFHVTSTNTVSGVIKGTLKDKKERQKKKRQRKKASM